LNDYYFRSLFPEFQARDNQVVVFLQRLAAHKEKVDEVLEDLHTHVMAQCEAAAADAAPTTTTPPLPPTSAAAE